MFRMGRNIARSIHRAITHEDSVDVSEIDGVRSLHLGSDTVQSSMRVKAPYDLELKYTRGMMVFLLFNKQVRNLTMIGLGGGSVPKYIYQYLPQIACKVIEINSRIIQVARSHFFVPADEFLPTGEARFEVIQADGAVYVAEHADSMQVLVIDAFDSRGIPQDLCTQAFFDDCAEALTADGMLVVNLWGSDRNFDVYLQRIEQSFQQRVLVMPTGRPGNIIVFGFKRAPQDLRWSTLRERARALEAEYKIEFMDFIERLRDHNPNTPNRLLLERESAE